MVTTRTLTAEDLWATPEDARGELLDGEMLPVNPVTNRHGVVVMRLGSRLTVWAEEHRFGDTGTEVGFLLRREPDTVLAPDVSLVAASDTADLPSRGFAEAVPVLAAEVLSPDDSPREIARKVAISLGAGVALVWVVDPARRTVAVHQPGREPRVLGGDDVLEGGEVLPGFAVALAYLFA